MRRKFEETKIMLKILHSKTACNALKIALCVDVCVVLSIVIREDPR